MKKIAFILVFIVCSIVTMAQRYDNGIILQSLTDTLTRGQPIGTHITLLDSSSVYILNVAQVVGVSLATIIAADEAVKGINENDFNGTDNRIPRWNGITALENSGIADSSNEVAITILDNEYVGIKTETPNGDLNIAGVTNTKLIVQATNGNDASFELNEIGNDWGVVGTNGYRIVDDGGDNRIYFQAGAGSSVSTIMSHDRATMDVAIKTEVPLSNLFILTENDASGGIRMQSSLSNITNKNGRLKIGHYTNTEEPVTMILATSTSSSSILNFGGGSSSENAAKTIAFYTAANTTTTTGTKVGEFDITGLDITGILTVSGTGRFASTVVGQPATTDSMFVPLSQLNDTIENYVSKVGGDTITGTLRVNLLEGDTKVNTPLSSATNIINADSANVQVATSSYDGDLTLRIDSLDDGQNGVIFLNCGVDVDSVIYACWSGAGNGTNLVEKIQNTITGVAGNLVTITYTTVEDSVFIHQGVEGGITVNASTITLADRQTAATHYMTFAASATGNQSQYTDAGLGYNPNTNVLTTSTFAGALSGNSTTATTLETTRAIYGNNFNGSTALDQAIIGTYGGTGVNNSTRTMTYAGNVAFTGAHNVSFTMPGAYTYTFPPSTSTLVNLDDTQTLEEKRWTARVDSITAHATPTIDTDDVDIFMITAQDEAITSMTSELSGTPVMGDILQIRITGTAARAITWGTSFVASTTALPTTTVTTATLTVFFQYCTSSSYGNNKWVCMSVN